MRSFIYIQILLLLLSSSLFSQADLSTKQVINDVVIYQDFHKKDLFYYAPSGLELVKDENGKPKFKFLQMRYTGTKTTGDQGTTRFRSLLSFSVAQYQLTQEERAQLVKEIKNNGFTISKLQPIAISNLKATLIHGADTAQDSAAHKVSRGFFQGSENEASSNWKERDYILRLHNEDSQLLAESFKTQQPTLSVNYTYSAKGYNTFKEELTAPEEVMGRRLFEDEIAEKDSIKNLLEERIITSGVLKVELDTLQWPDLIEQIDINELMPPDYAVLDVYCFDFNNEIRPDLYAKRIEVKATSVGGNEVTFKHTFKYTEPDEYAKTIKFIYAVKLSEPYQYRITEILHDGNYTRSDWETRDSWNELLDITTISKEN